VEVDHPQDLGGETCLPFAIPDQKETEIQVSGPGGMKIGGFASQEKEFPGSAVDRKAVKLSRSLAPFQIDVRHLRVRLVVPAAMDHCQDVFLPSFKESLHGSVGKVPHPSGQVGGNGISLRMSPKEDALNPAVKDAACPDPGFRFGQIVVPPGPSCRPARSGWPRHRPYVPVPGFGLPECPHHPCHTPVRLSGE